MKKLVLCALIGFQMPSLLTASDTSINHSPSYQPSDASPYLVTATHAFIYAGVAGLIMLIGKGVGALSEKNLTFSTTNENEPTIWAGPLPRAFEKVLDLQRHPERFKKFNMDPPRGYLLYGPPGTGKTMLAQVLAQKMKIPLIKENSGNFISMYQGSGTSYFSALLKKAHNVPTSPDKPFKCIIFIDEIDGITSRKESPNREELRIAEHILTAITAQENNNILFLGATNLFESVDKALVRPGRLTPVKVGLPSPAHRKALFEHFFKKHHFPVQEVSPILLAESTEGFSCADIKAVIEEAIYRHIKHPTYLPEVCIEQSITAYKRILTTKQI